MDKREEVRKLTLQVIEERGSLTTTDVSGRIENIPAHSVAQFIRHNYSEWGLERELQNGQWVYAKGKERIPPPTPRKIVRPYFRRRVFEPRERRRDEFKIPKKVEETEYKISPSKAHQLLKDGLNPRDAKKVYSSAKRYCDTSCDAPSNSSPMITCVDRCDIWKVKNKALKLLETKS